jgi:hypothetical protein
MRNAGNTTPASTKNFVVDWGEFAGYSKASVVLTAGPEASAKGSISPLQVLSFLLLKLATRAVAFFMPSCRLFDKKLLSINCLNLKLFTFSMRQQDTISCIPPLNFGMQGCPHA